jgi:PAP2 superfamily protein
VRFTAVLLCGLIPASAALGESIIHSVASEVRQYSRDARAMVLAPGTWRAHDWVRVGAVLTTVGVLMREDARIGREVQRHRTAQSDSFARTVTPFGGGRALQLSVAMIIAGAATRQTQLRDIGRDSFEAEEIAAGIITPLLKRGFGRARPNQDEMLSHDFDPWSGQESFPSGHATNTFALASVIAARSNGWIAPTIAYATATSVALARMNDNAHWASDVVAGAAIGTVTGRFLVRRHLRQRWSSEFMLVPIAGERRVGLVFRAIGW